MLPSLTIMELVNRALGISIVAGILLVTDFGSRYKIVLAEVKLSCRGNLKRQFEVGSRMGSLSSLNT